jgi:hypothetical protein
MAQQQGNVLLIAVIDRQGKLRDIVPIATSNEGFVDASVAAAKLWRFKPATRNGKPVEIAANIGMRFRLQLPEKRGQLPRPMLGNVDISPADANGRATGPQGFPIRQGGDPKLYAEALVDVPANSTELRVPVVVPIKPDWEDGIWMLRFFVADADAGGGQFWLAKDPSTFDFTSKMPKPQALPN